MILLMKRSVSDAYRRRGMPAPAAISGNVEDLLTPAHPNRSGELVLRAGLCGETVVYYEAHKARQSKSDAWKRHHYAKDAERLMIHSFLASGEFVQVQTSFGILFYRKSEEAG